MKWTKKPMTWGGYAKFCGITTLISMVITGGYCVYLFWGNISNFFVSKYRRLVHKDD